MVFSYGKLDINETIVNDISYLLSLGLKFSPSIINNDFDYWSFLLKELDTSLRKFISTIFFSKVNSDRECPGEKISESYQNSSI